MTYIATSFLVVISYIGLSQMLGLNRQWVSIPLQIWVCWFLLCGVYKAIRYFCYGGAKVNLQFTPLLPTSTIFFEPVTITFRHQIIRIPLEDQVDLDFDDSHNVHNKTVKRTAVQAIESLKQSDQQRYTVESAIGDIFTTLSEGIKRHTVLNSPKETPEGHKNEITSNMEAPLEVPIDQMTLAGQVLAKIDRMKCLYVTANIREREILRLVWERINHPVNADRIALLKENFIKELADCSVGDSLNGDRLDLHCCEGRVTRLLQSLQECDAENIVSLRPMWAFKEEIANKITKYREKLLKKGPELYRHIELKLELNDQDKLDINKFNSCLIANLQKRFQRDYLDPGYLTQGELDDLTQVYYESLYDY